MFGVSAGFPANGIQTSGGVWRIDMLKCPYHDACARYNCPELCHCFCDSDDITYEGLHKKLVWRRTKTAASRFLFREKIFYDVGEMLRR